MEAGSNVETLKVVQRPKAEERVQAEAHGHLSALAKLNAEGQIATLFCIVLHPDGTFSEAITSTTKFREMVGQIEIVKQNWVNSFLASLKGHPIGGGGK